MAESNKDVWEDLNQFRMDPESIQQCIKQAPGCAVTWVDKTGRAMGVWITPTVIDGEVWVTTTTNRSKTRAWMKDNRTVAVFGVPGLGSVTIVGTVELKDDAELRYKFLDSLYRRNRKPEEIDQAQFEHWMKAMNSEGRLVGPLKVEKYITFDERKLPRA